MRKFINFVFVFVFVFVTPNLAFANQLVVTSLPGAKKLSLDKQYYAASGSSAVGKPEC